MLAGGIADLAGHAPTMDAAHALQGAVNAARLLFGVDGAGVMLADPGGRLHWAVASDQVAQLAEDNQEVTVQGPCQVAFAQRRPVHLRDADAERVWGEITLLYADGGVRAALSVPVELAGGPVGTLDLFARQPRDWQDTDVVAVRAYAGVVAGLLGGGRRGRGARRAGRIAPVPAGRHRSAAGLVCFWARRAGLRWVADQAVGW